MNKPKTDYVPNLPNGNDFFETASAFQKYLRRCNTNAALNFGYDLFDRYHNYVWKRLVTVVFEDVGFANLSLSNDIICYYQSYKALIDLKDPNAKKLAWLATAKAITIVSESNKSRLVDNAKIYALKCGETFEPSVTKMGRPDDDLIESFREACQAKDSDAEKRALYYAHKYCSQYTTKVFFNSVLEFTMIAYKPETLKQIAAIKFLYDEFLAAKKSYKLSLTFLVLVLCRADADTSLNEAAKETMLGKHIQPIPDFAVDFHTRRGKKKGLKFFASEGSKLEKQVFFEGDDFYLTFANKYFHDYDDGIVTEDGYNSKDKPQQTLFG